MRDSIADSMLDDPLAATMLEDPFDASLNYPPYPGLRPFISAEWPIFFGRETMTDEIIDLVTKKHLVVVHGDSGSGKSSIVRAGVLVQLQQGHAATDASWRTCAMLPRDDALGNLARALAGLLAEPTPDQILDVRHILNRGRRAPETLSQLLRQGESDHICILVDQFEELFTFAERRGPEEARLFVDLLVALQENPPPGLYAILTMRSEFLGWCARFEGLAEAVNRTQYLLPRMERPALLRAIREPATLYGGEVSQELAERLIADAGGGQDHLPLIQHGLMRLWRRKPGSPIGLAEAAAPHGYGELPESAARFEMDEASPSFRGNDRPVWRLGLEIYRGAGGLAALLSDHADEVLAQAAPDPERQKVVEHLFRALTGINADGNAIRRPQTFAALMAVTASDALTLKAIIDRFRAAGVSLLKPYGNAAIGPDTLIDVSHEALIRCWWRIAEPKDGWLVREFRDGLVWRALLVQAESFERDTANVLSPATTEERRRWLQRRTPAWAERYGGGWDRVRKLIQASVKASQDAKRREEELLSGLAKRNLLEAQPPSDHPHRVALDPKRDDTGLETLRARADDSLSRLRGPAGDDDLAAAKGLVEELRNAREYDRMGGLAEAVSRRDPKDPKNRRLYAQYLIDTGKATAAVDVLQPLIRRLPKDHPEFAEATGLLGRAYKQMFFDAGDKTSAGAPAALKQAIEAYRKPFEENRSNTWHGVNLVALLTRARRLGLRMAPDLQPKEVAKEVVAALEATPESRRDEWFLPTLAEASLGLGDWDAVERNVRAYAAATDAKSFQIASTLRQFTEVWDLEATDDRGRGLVAMLRARLLQLPGSGLEIAPYELQRLRAQPAPDARQLEAVLGTAGAQTYRWWRTGLDRALAVAAIRQRLGGRLSTGFLVRAGDLGLEPGEEPLVMTNFHIVNEHGASPGVKPEDAEVVFEAADPDQVYLIDRIVWSSPIERHDATILRLQTPVTEIPPLPIAKSLPALEDTARVYIIGHPGGRDLVLSFQDNELLDHEGPTAGKPQIPGVCRVHYRAPTEGGSSGSPVFNARLWEVIALHHKGGKIGMPKLNGLPGEYAANEGVSIHSIKEAIARR
jgi:Trypsin-like peptidase domain/MAP3K TRAFs-binding domain/NACHT domain